MEQEGPKTASLGEFPVSQPHVQLVPQSIGRVGTQFEEAFGQTWHGIRRTKAMALPFHYKAGEAQSRAAGHYFGLVAHEILGARLGDLEAKHVIISQDDAPNMPWRLWMSSEPTSESMGELAPWIRQVRDDLHGLGLRQSRPVLATTMVQRWMEAPRAEHTFFAEMLHPAAAFAQDDDSLFSLAVVSGETVLLSTPDVMYVQLASDQFGLAIAHKGSFLIERGHGHPHALRA